MKKNSIKNTYSDALYWATSTQTKNEGYHLTRTEEPILRKLIHYSRSKETNRKSESITYSNTIIAKHTYMGEETIRKAIPRIAKKGWISTAAIKIVNGGEIKTRRTIFIKWDFIQNVLDNIPKEKVTEDSKTLEDNVQELTEVPEPQPIELPKNEDKQASITKLTTSDIYPIPEIVITDEKLKWVQDLTKNRSLSKEELTATGQDLLHELFYNGTGIWQINKDSMENHYRIKFTHRGGSLGHIYDNSQSNDRIQISVNDFKYYLDQRGIEFSQFTPKMYKGIKTYGLSKKPIAS